MAAGTSYVTFVAIIGTEPLLATGTSAPFDLSDLGAGLVLGMLCGVLARVGSWAIARVKRIAQATVARIPVIVVGSLALAATAHWGFDDPVHLGPGYLAIGWPDQARPNAAGTRRTVHDPRYRNVDRRGRGGAGGLFIPLVTQGAIVGSIVQRILAASNDHLLPSVGIAAFLGAGYCTPLAGVAFVAQATGQPGFLVPALLAAQLVMGGRSFSGYQQSERRADH